MHICHKLLSVVGMFALATSASAQIGNFQSKSEAELKIDGVDQTLTNPVTSPFYVSGTGGGAGYSTAAVNSGGSIFFQSGSMAAGTGNTSRSVVEISFDVTNNGSQAIDQMISTVFESNFGLFVANFKDAPGKPACSGANLANCTPTSAVPGFSDFSVQDGSPPSTLAFTSFAFEVLQDSNVVGKLAGSIRLDSLGEGGLAFIQGPGFGSLSSTLNNFTSFGNAPDRVYAFSWEDTDFTADLNPILQNQTSKLTYRITSESWSDVTFSGAFDNLIVAFSCFADPLGRGSTASVFTIPGFGPSTCNDYRASSPGAPSPYALKFPVIRDGKVIFTGEGAPGIPEPDTWAMLILGFGLVGFSMRRRSAKAAVSA